MSLNVRRPVSSQSARWILAGLGGFLLLLVVCGGLWAAVNETIDRRVRAEVAQVTGQPVAVATPALAQPSAEPATAVSTDSSASDPSTEAPFAVIGADTSATGASEEVPSDGGIPMAVTPVPASDGTESGEFVRQIMEAINADNMNRRLSGNMFISQQNGIAVLTQPGPVEEKQFSDCNMRGIDFRGRRLNRDRFFRCDLRGANFTAAGLERAWFVDCIFDEKTVFKYATLRWTNFVRCKTEAVPPDSWQTRLEDTEFRWSPLQSGDYTGVYFKSCLFQGMDMSGMRGSSMTFKSCMVTPSTILPDNNGQPWEKRQFMVLTQ